MNRTGRPKGAKSKKVTQKDLHNLSIEVIQEAMAQVINRIQIDSLCDTELEQMTNLLHKMENVLYGYKRAEQHRKNLKKAHLKHLKHLKQNNETS